MGLIWTRAWRPSRPRCGHYSYIHSGQGDLTGGLTPAWLAHNSHRTSWPWRVMLNKKDLEYQARNIQPLRLRLTI